jgi:hypothetical protein
MRVWLLSTCLLLAACEGVIGSLPTDQRGPYVPPTLSCDVSQFPGVRLEEAIGVFAQQVYPSLTAGPSECVSCHAPTSGRRFTVTTDATETFHLARTAGFFKDEPGSLLSRVTNPNDAVRMPLGTPALSVETVEALNKAACMVRAFEASGGPAADEQFPPELLTPYTGTPIDSYDNPFLNFVQLKAKVKSVFADDWVRGGVDQFERNIGLFGGVNFRTHFVEARAATPDFLLGLDALAPEVCQPAATNGTGPFAGLSLSEPLVDTPAQSDTTVQIETLTVSPAANVGAPDTNPPGFFCYTNCTFTTPYTLPSPGTYRVTVRGKATLEADGSGPSVQVQIGATAGTPLVFTSTAAYEEKSVDIVVTTAGMSTVSASFTNDANALGGDRNLHFDWIKITGPLGTGSGTTRADAAKQKLSTLYSRMLYRPATAAEQGTSYALLSDLSALGSLSDAWSGVCEALVRHPDFLFTMPPAVETQTMSTEQEKLWLVALTQRALGRPPTTAEFSKLSADGYPAMIDAVFASPDFRAYYFNRIQLRIESQGTPESDEPARLWTYVTLNGRSFEEVLTAEYTVDEQYAEQPRDANHGKTGLLTTKGYLNNKPGLPHYNFPARVLSGFMGSIFEVPPEVFDQRGTSTASSTVDPASICFNCHQLLTPLAHQRLKWADDGTFRETMMGAPIDDTDRGLVPTYPYKGAGLEAFTTRAVKKEPFVRRMINTQVKLLLGRELRSSTDERVLYKQFWDTTFANGGDMRAVLKAVAHSSNFKGTP